MGSAKTLVRKMRRQASQQREELAKKQNYKCFYCDCEVYTQERVESLGSTYTGNDGSKLFASKDGVAVEYPFATIEHLLKLCQGGGNEVGNLVIACVDCNHGREIKEQQQQKHGAFDDGSTQLPEIPHWVGGFHGLYRKPRGSFRKRRYGRRR